MTFKITDVETETTDNMEDDTHIAEANRAPENLDEMLEVMQANATWPGAPGYGELDWTSLPNFGGPDPDDTDGVWSWDAERLLIGTHSEDMEIVTRTEWDNLFAAHAEDETTTRE